MSDYYYHSGGYGYSGTSSSRAPTSHAASSITFSPYASSHASTAWTGYSQPTTSYASYPQQSRPLTQRGSQESLRPDDSASNVSSNQTATLAPQPGLAGSQLGYGAARAPSQFGAGPATGQFGQFGSHPAHHASAAPPPSQFGAIPATAQFGQFGGYPASHASVAPPLAGFQRQSAASTMSYNGAGQTPSQFRGPPPSNFGGPPASQVSNNQVAMYNGTGGSIAPTAASRNTGTDVSSYSSRASGYKGPMIGGRPATYFEITTAATHARVNPTAAKLAAELVCGMF